MTFSKCGHCGAGRLLEAGDRLTMDRPAGGAVGLLELGQLLPSKQSSCPNTYRFGSLLMVPVREQCGNRLLHLPAEFCSVAPHLQSPAIICCDAIAIPSPSQIYCTIRLLLQRTGAIHVVDAVITAKGECEMNTTIAEKNETTQASTTTDQPKATKKARVAQHRAHVAPSKSKSGKKATSAKNAAKSPKKAAPPKATVTREGSKTEKILDLLKRPGGATLKELIKATGWQAHSVRGFLSILGKKKGLAVESTKSTEGERTYSIKG